MLMMFLSTINTDEERDVFVKLYKEHRYSMFSYAYSKLRDHALAEDAVHETFVRLAENIHRFDFSRDSRALLLTLTHHAIYNRIQKEKHEILIYDNPVDSEISGEVNIETRVENAELVDRIADFVASLSEKYSTVFTLHYQHNLKDADIAAILDLKPATVRKRLQRVREMISREFSDK